MKHLLAARHTNQYGIVSALQDFETGTQMTVGNNQWSVIARARHQGTVAARHTPVSLGESGGLPGEAVIGNEPPRGVWFQLAKMDGSFGLDS